MKYKEMQCNSKIRINFLLPGFGLKPIGGFKIVYTYANYLSRHGYIVTIFHSNNIDKKKTIYKYLEYLESRVRLILNPPKWFRFDKKIHKRYIYSFSNQTVRNADITIATAWNTVRDLNGLNSKKGNKLHIIQGYEVCLAPKSDVHEAWMYDMKKIVVSSWLLEIGKQLGCTDIEYIPNSINYSKYKIINQISERNNVISMMYCTSKLKGSKDGIAALKILKGKYPEIRAIIFGVDERPSELPKWMEYFNNPKEEVLVSKIYNEASIFLSTSYSEGWGLPPMEAMACGCAVVTTASGGVEDFAIHNETALLCKAGNISEMVEDIGLLLNDKEIRYRLALNGSNYIKKFTWKKSFHEFEKILKSMLEN